MKTCSRCGIGMDFVPPNPINFDPVTVILCSECKRKVYETGRCTECGLHVGTKNTVCGLCQTCQRKTVEKLPATLLKDEIRKSLELVIVLENKLRDLEEENHNLKLRLRIALSQIDIVRKTQQG